ncbi:phosphoribosylglycinamide formyltransferase [Photobacterium sp. DNB22_13_2]
MIAKSLFRTCFVLLCVFGRGPVANAAVPQFTDSEFKLPSPTQDTKDNFQRSLSGLFSIPSFRQEALSQPYNEFDKLYQHAQAAQQELEQMLTQVSLHTEAQPIIPGVKSRERAEQKIATELNGQPEKLTDLARGTLVANNISSLVDAFNHLSRESTIVETKNRFKQPASSGYRDLKLLVQLPQTGLIAEVQLHLDTIAEIKSGPEHDIYETIQHIERQASQEQRLLNDIEVAKIKVLRQESQQLYQQAWHQYLQPEPLALAS